MASPPDQRLTRLSDPDIYWIRMLNDGRITGAQQGTGRVFVNEPVALDRHELHSKPALNFTVSLAKLYFLPLSLKDGRISLQSRCTQLILY